MRERQKAKGGSGFSFIKLRAWASHEYNGTDYRESRVWAVYVLFGLAVVSLSAFC